MADKYGSPSGSYSWLPDFVRKWLNLDEEVPDYGPGAEVGAPLAPPAARPAPAYGAAPTPDYGAAPAPGYAPKPSYTPPTPTYTPPTPTYRAFAAGGPSEPSAPPPPAPRLETGVTPSAPLPPVEGVVQPIGYLIRSYVRGALPPQGLEQFTREARATFTDVWKFYSYWTRFQTDELFRMGREFSDALFGGRGRSLEGGNGGREQPRRIRVTTANDSEETKKPAQSIAPSPSSNAPPSTAASAATAAAATAGKATETAAKASEKAAETAAKASEKASEATGKAAEAAKKAAGETGKQG
ncbi:MAG: hypothetical protein ACUVS4_02265 [Chloroflexaceae bacterium]